MPILSVLIGAASLLAGRRLYWLFVGAVGFAVAADLAVRLAGVDSPWLLILIALAGGIIGAILAVFLQRAAIGLAGFLAGGYIVLAMFELAGVDLPLLPWILALVGGILAVGLTLAVFEWALILLSSLAGAGIIVQAAQLTGSIAWLAFALLLVIGIAIQASSLTTGGR